jgi:hypothetical protein
MKKPKPKAIKLLGNIRIRQESAAKAQKRAANVLFANQVRAQQMANMYQLELQRADNLLQYQPPGLQREAIMLNRGRIQKRFDNIKL